MKEIDERDIKEGGRMIGNVKEEDLKEGGRGKRKDRR